MGIFDKRLSYKPFEYPGIYQFTEAINNAFWVHSEVDFTADTQDFHSHLSPAERSAIKNSLLAIAQIEVAVKSFWGNLYHHFPKPEFNGLGSTFAECEFRHSEAYSHSANVLPKPLNSASLDILKRIRVCLMFWIIMMSSKSS